MRNSEPTHRAIARAVAVSLARSGRTQTWLAGELGVSTSWMSSRMQGHTVFDVTDIDRIADALGMANGFALVALAETEAVSA